jgi:hypothetical protein
LPDREADVIKRDPRAVAVADAVDLECGGVSEVELFQTRRPLGSMRFSSQACQRQASPRATLTQIVYPDKTILKSKLA